MYGYYQKPFKSWLIVKPEYIDEANSLFDDVKLTTAKVGGRPRRWKTLAGARRRPLKRDDRQSWRASAKMRIFGGRPPTTANFQIWRTAADRQKQVKLQKKNCGILPNQRSRSAILDSRGWAKSSKKIDGRPRASAVAIFQLAVVGGRPREPAGDDAHRGIRGIGGLRAGPRRTLSIWRSMHFSPWRAPADDLQNFWNFFVPTAVFAFSKFALSQSCIRAQHAARST